MEELLKLIKEELKELSTEQEELSNIDKEKKNKLAEKEAIENEFQSLQIGDMRKVIKQKEIEQKNAELNALEKTYNEKNDNAKKDFEIKKANFKGEIDKRLSLFQFKADVDKIKEEIEEKKKQQEEQERNIATLNENVKELLEKQMNGDSSAIWRIQNTQSYIENHYKIRDELKKEIDESEQKLSECIVLEDNQEEYANLKNLEQQINVLSIEKIDNLEKNVDEISSKYNKKEPEEVKLEDFLAEEEPEEEPEEEKDEHKYTNYGTRYIPEPKFTKMEDASNKEELKSNINANLKPTNPRGFLHYKHENSKKQAIEDFYDRDYYNKAFNDYKISGFGNGEINFDKEALKRLDPLLLKHLEDRLPDLAEKVAEKISKHEDLSEYKDLFVYDMKGAEKLGFRDKWLCRKIAKKAIANGLEVKNIEATRTLLGKLIAKTPFSKVKRLNKPKEEERLALAEKITTSSEKDRVSEFKDLQKVKVKPTVVNIKENEEGEIINNYYSEYTDQDKKRIEKNVEEEKIKHNNKMKQEQEERE